MGDNYKELLVKREKQTTDTLKAAGMIALTVLAVLAGLFLVPMAMIVAIALAAVSYYLIPGWMNVEYEYLYVNGSFDIDRIMNRQKRKRAGSYDLENMEIAAVTGSAELNGFKDAKVSDFTSQKEGVPSWTIVYNKNGAIEAVKLELDNEIIDDLWRRAPRKVLKTH